MRRPLAAVALVVAVAGFAAGVSDSATTKIPPAWRNCSAVNKRFPHGIGKLGAHDKTSGIPVTNFEHSNMLYTLAMYYNRGLDSDHDGIACEQA